MSEGPSARVLHPRLDDATRRRLLVRGLARFVRGDYYAAHEPWEEIWRSDRPQPRDLLRGLIQVAAALHHVHEHGRAAAALRLLLRARRSLEPLSPCCLGLDLGRLLEDLGGWERWLAAQGRGIDPGASLPPPPRLEVLDCGAFR
jgi:hypothetical protein